MTNFGSESVQFDQELTSVSTNRELNDLRVKYLGRNGLLSSLRKQVDFKAMSEEQKREIGNQFNELKAHFEAALKDAGDRLNAITDLGQFDFDLTLAPLFDPPGAIHPIAAVTAEVEDIFRSMGFSVYTGHEAVSEYENFDALNIPIDHPARDMQDTFWLTNGMVLRTHTSAMQNRAMRELGAPLRAIFPGRCFRNEATDATHENTFYQLEGLMVDHNVTVGNLIAVMKEMLGRVFNTEADVRLRPGYFPFVEPGFELDFRSAVVGTTRWIELMPCGMVHPVVLRNAGVDPSEFSGFAFGLGLTRLAMLKFGIPDVRLFNKGDIRFYEQFLATV